MILIVTIEKTSRQSDGRRRDAVKAAARTRKEDRGSYLSRPTWANSSASIRSAASSFCCCTVSEHGCSPAAGNACVSIETANSARGSIHVRMGGIQHSIPHDMTLTVRCFRGCRSTRRMIKIAAFNAQLRSGHLFTIAHGRLKERVRSLPRIPIEVRTVGSRLFVWRDLSHRNIPPGSEILTINGRRTAEIVALSWPKISSDGLIDI